jgi:hypothetical protein
VYDCEISGCLCCWLMEIVVVNLIRSYIVKGLMGRSSTKSLPQFGAIVKRVKIEISIIQCPPQSFYGNVIMESAFAAHANPDLSESSTSIKLLIVNCAP